VSGNANSLLVRKSERSSVSESLQVKFHCGKKKMFPTQHSRGKTVRASVRWAQEDLADEFA
jgi:hypothetical protein